MKQMDKWIGQNVERLRAAVEMKQAEVAFEMSEQGFKWSQRTVWAVEKGERPLRLAEAQVLAKLLRTGTGQFVTPPEAVKVVNAVFDAERLCKKALGAISGGLEDANAAHMIARSTLMDMEEEGVDLDAVRDVVPSNVVGRYEHALDRIRHYDQGGIATFLNEAQQDFARIHGWDGNRNQSDEQEN
ncbi:helix-turn-helix transcriptional regulator [Nesterenkonia natronophila]|uniref:XRE family transcriptional regulator n=1 Tax=Nesterenkonia natronophila TaxID=2174932 RepID=A0A3A4FDQ0_9MICC|nr:helix-turn-helix transcriptional regulator [Nesterenkonia natronophila]RJN32914.1 XRE family transcriptional regulator [Nesterenkonia natronophila]